MYLNLAFSGLHMLILVYSSICVRPTPATYQSGEEGPAASAIQLELHNNLLQAAKQSVLPVSCHIDYVVLMCVGFDICNVAVLVYRPFSGSLDW